MMVAFFALISFPACGSIQPHSWRRSLKSMVAVLRQGLATPEHAAFVARVAIK
jgi:hypothetical protein